MCLWGQAALDERTAWHVAFDLAVMQVWWRHKNEVAAARQGPRGQARLWRNRVDAFASRGTGLSLPDLPAERG